jgi:hypothetical protein
VTRAALSITTWVPSPAVKHVSSLPPSHPGRRDFPDPVGNEDLSRRSLPMPTQPLSDGTHADRVITVCFAFREVSNSSLSVRRPTLPARFSSPSSSRAPLLGRYCPPSSLLRAHEPLLMPLPSISFSLYEVPLPLVPSTAGHQELPDFILLIFPRVPRPLPRRSIGCSQPVLLRQLRPSQPSDRLGFPRLSH